MIAAPSGLVEELGLERATVAELEAERELAWARRDYGCVSALRGQLAGARDHVVALELLVEREGRRRP